MSQPDALQYLRRVWRIVVLQMIVDISAALVIVFLVALIVAGLVFVSGHSFGVSYLHVRESAEILGGVYVLAVWARTLRRHWIVAGQVKS